MFGRLIYAPHKMYVLKSEKTFDDFGNYIGTTETCEYLCDCRCDDAGVQDAITVNGERFFPSYHVVCEARVENGAQVRIMDGGKIRAEGKVVRTNNSNYFKKHEAWI